MGNCPDCKALLENIESMTETNRVILTRLIIAKDALHVILKSTRDAEEGSMGRTIHLFTSKELEKIGGL
jgi:hypothetical protein